MGVEVHHVVNNNKRGRKKELNTYDDLYILSFRRHHHIPPIHRHDHRLIRRRLDILNTCPYTKPNTIRLIPPPQMKERTRWRKHTHTCQRSRERLW